MKWKILSAVVALHLVVGGGLLLSGGCKNPTPASPRSPSGTANSGTGSAPVPVAPPVVTSTDTGAPIVNPGTATPVIDTPPPSLPGDTNAINNNGLGAAINGQPTGVSTSYTVVKGDNLSRIAKKHGTTIRALQEANNLTSADLKVGQTLVIPAAGISSSGLPNVEGSPALGDITEYTVVKGDSLDRISKKTGVSVSDLKAANKLKSDTIQLGQTLRIPGKHDLNSLSAPIAPKSTGNLGVKPGPAIAAPADGASTYTVKAGDTPDLIARRHGMTTRELLALNGNFDPRRLQIGQKLNVKGSGAPATPDSLTPVPANPVPAKTEPATPVPANPEPATPGQLPLISFGPSGSTPAAPTPVTPVPAAPANTGEALPITPVTN